MLEHFSIKLAVLPSLGPVGIETEKSINHGASVVVVGNHDNTFGRITKPKTN
jgi:hypothetical protein